MSSDIRFYVYFITECQPKKRKQRRHGRITAEQCFCKIGYSNNPDKRLKDMQVGNPRRLTIATKFGPMDENAARELEADIHRKFKTFHVRGEWFSTKVLAKLPWLKG